MHGAEHSVDAAIRAIGDRARAARTARHDPVMTVRHIAPWSLKARPADFDAALLEHRKVVAKAGKVGKQHDVAWLRAQIESGKTNQQIADGLGCSIGTVRRARRRHGLTD